MRESSENDSALFTTGWLHFAEDSSLNLNLLEIAFYRAKRQLISAAVTDK